MKRIISLIIITALTLSVLLSAIPSFAATSEGNAIKSEADFLAMSESGKYYLENDITVSSSYEKVFKGTLDGNGKKIKLSEGANISPFKKIEGASFKNLTVEGVINVTVQQSYGGIAVEGYGSFNNVTAKVGISAMVLDSFNSVATPQGCFIAKATGGCSFTNCKNEASVTVVTQSGGSIAPTETGFGGFIGTASSAGSVSFTDCKNDASVTSIEPRVSVGGFVGISLNTNLTFDTCENNAIVIGGTANEDAYHIGAGGFIGTLSQGSLTIKDCKNVADVQIYNKYGHVGGCVGRVANVLNISIDGFRNMRAIYNLSNGWEGAGGLIGIMSDVPAGSSGSYLFRDCINSAWVNGSMAGGIVGIDNGCHGINMKFERCANTAPIKSLGVNYSGGILGRTNGSLSGLTFSQCLNTGEITTSDGGYGVGGIVGNIGVDGVSYVYTPTFKGCINTGSIVCKTTINTQGNVVAAGILARSTYMPASFEDCINLGTLSNSCLATNVAHIAPSFNSINHSVSDCSYLSTLGGSAIWGEVGKSLADIRADIATALTDGLLPEAEYYNYESVRTAINTVNNADSVAKVAEGATQILLSSSALLTVDEKKAELLDTLGEPITNSNGEYTADSYAEYLSEFEKIKSDINAASTAQSLNVIDLNSLIESAESKLVEVNDTPQGDTPQGDTPQGDTPTEPNAPETDTDENADPTENDVTDPLSPNAPQTESGQATNGEDSDSAQEKAKKGCFSSASLSVLTATCIIGASLSTARKKRN